MPMSKQDFSEKEFDTRQRRVREAMARQGIDVLIVIAPTNIQYLLDLFKEEILRGHHQKFRTLLSIWLCVKS